MAQQNTTNDILDMLDKIKFEIKAQSKEQYIPDIIEFCESKHYLDLSAHGTTLYSIQKIILKTFYRGQPGNENLKLDATELQLLFALKLNDVIDKYHSGHLFKELVLVLGRRCVSEDTMIFDANSGESKSISDWHNEDGKLDVWTYNEQYKKFEINHAKTLKQGSRKCFRVTLSNGDYIDCTSNHPLLTPSGWKQIKELKPGDMIAQNNYIPKPDDGEDLQEHEASILGYIIGDGNCTTSRAYFSCEDSQVLIHLQQCLDQLSDNMMVKKDANPIQPQINPA